MKSVLITGVSSGIGFASARYFLEQGYQVFGSVRKSKDAIRLENEFKDRFTTIVFDITDRESVEKAFSQIAAHLNGKGLDVLVNNAGISGSAPMAYIDIKDFEKQLNVNVLGVLNVIQVFLPLLGFANKKAKGQIINISSGAGRVTRPFMGSYSASKHALEAMSDALRRELISERIRVTVVEPGPIKSEIWSKARNGGDPEKYVNTPYENIYKKMDKVIDSMESNALAAEEVAKVIYQVAEGKRRNTRYLVAPKKWMFWLAIHLFPDKLLDRLFEKQFVRLVRG
ncbi:SDR family oxidoreductase [Robertkochia solimangrovi]|uniref:SDR family oxidoreductase n=1 Tax=Robertkochia solimangrovi TaxID=2213046 RepID=UPI00117E98B5|nr:SDR family oxidoreductase [Robertkochia solimangrovi]TRZ45358.1 alcohol dehydrogenase [Robertkochia solimangrovi]